MLDPEAPDAVLPEDAPEDEVPLEAPVEDPPPEDSEKELVAYFTDLVKVPSHMERWYEKFGEDREYVNELSMRMDEADDDVVSTNYIYRSQRIFLANLMTRDPKCRVSPRPMLGDMPLLGVPFFKTLEMTTNFMAQRAGVKDVAVACSQDASTHGIAIVKVTPQDDYKLDPLGLRRVNDLQDNLAKLQYYQNRADAGELRENSPEWALYQDCQDTVQKAMIEAQMQELHELGPEGVEPGDPRMERLMRLEAGEMVEGDIPEVLRYLGISYNTILPEDFRADWSLSRYEDFYQAEWMGHRVFMAREDIAAKYDLTPDEWRAIKLVGSDNSPMVGKAWSPYSDDPSNRDDLERTESQGRAVVWEIDYRPTGKTYTFIEGVGRFVRKSTPVTWHKFYRYIPIGYNVVTGRWLPLSDVTLARRLQEEINSNRTNRREALRRIWPRVFVRRGSLDSAEKGKAEDSLGFSVIEVDDPDEVRKAFAETATIPFDNNWFVSEEARSELEQMTGISRNASGTPSGTVATTAAIANEQMKVQSLDRQVIVDQFLSDLFQCTAEILLKILPPQNVQRLIGPGAVWPASMAEREQLYQYTMFEVRGHGAGRPQAQERVALLKEIAMIARDLMLPLNSLEFLKILLEEADMPDLTIERLVLMGMPGAPPGAGPGGGRMGPPGGPDQPRPGPGAPPMSERGAPAPDQIPNAPRV